MKKVIGEGQDLVPDVFLRITLIEGYVEFLRYIFCKTIEFSAFDFQFMGISLRIEHVGVL